MKNFKNTNLKTALILGLFSFAFISCEREISDQAVLTTFSKDGSIFIDAFSGGLDYFPFGDSYQEAFSVDTKEVYQGSASMRFDIPVFGAGYGGANFPTSSPRDLSGYDALTFWAKASKGAIINEIGFGLTESNGNKYRAVRSNLPITTQWRKYIVPIPDPSKLTQETGLFWYAEGAQNANDEGGYTFWLDEVQFEKLGTVAQPRPAILNSQNIAQQTFIGSAITIDGLTQTFNLEDGTNPAVGAAPGYFDFETSDASVATVDEFGKVTVTGAGTAKITASIGGVTAEGSLQLESLGPFTPAPTPTVNASNVISIFSDAYVNKQVDYYNGYWAPFQTTLGQNDININGDNIIKYSELNFVGIQFTQPTINVSGMTHFHIDVRVEEAMQASDFLVVRLVDIGSDNAFGGGNDTSGEVRLTPSTLSTNNWASYDVQLSTLSSLRGKFNLAQIVFVTDASIKNILVDNIYFYK
ncbi:MAG: hypothetical protein WAO74_05165 [Polaribacter sp.]|uniref:hypothetical protein n=1 Tax=Polaribacter sp. TaxID=1920175 RepID=UPI003BAFBF69